jgi:hypothetical protein
MEPIEVTARFDADGRVHPIKFVWKGMTVPVASVGRDWKDQEGLHVLVMDFQGQAYELVFVLAENRWYLAQPRTTPGKILSI